MKFTKKQKEILRQIAIGKIYDIGSFVDYFHLSHIVRFDSIQLKNSFVTDVLPKCYYFPKDLRVSKSNMLSEDEFSKRLKNKALNPDNYVLKTLQLKHNTGIKTKVFNSETYKFNFYEGVSILNAIEDIFEFLILWQYLKSEMLVLELPQKCPNRTLGFFFVQRDKTCVKYNSINEKIDNIDYSDFSYSDQSYLEDEYVISDEYCTIYGDYLNKKISPSPDLNLFIQKGFCTTEEKTQRSALWAAWLAIAVSVILAFVPAIQNMRQPSEYGDILTIIAEEIETIERRINSNHIDETLVTRFDELSSKLDRIIEIYEEEVKNDELTNKINDAQRAVQTDPIFSE